MAWPLRPDMAAAKGKGGAECRQQGRRAHLQLPVLSQAVGVGQQEGTWAWTEAARGERAAPGWGPASNSVPHVGMNPKHSVEKKESQIKGYWKSANDTTSVDIFRTTELFPVLPRKKNDPRWERSPS